MEIRTWSLLICPEEDRADLLILSQEIVYFVGETHVTDILDILNIL